jgi:hypothetical protein
MIGLQGTLPEMTAHHGSIARCGRAGGRDRNSAGI